MFVCILYNWFSFLPLVEIDSTRLPSSIAVVTRIYKQYLTQFQHGMIVETKKKWWWQPLLIFLEQNWEYINSGLTGACENYRYPQVMRKWHCWWLTNGGKHCINSHGNSIVVLLNPSVNSLKLLVEFGKWN